MLVVENLGSTGKYLKKKNHACSYPSISTVNNVCISFQKEDFDFHIKRLWKLKVDYLIYQKSNNKQEFKSQKQSEAPAIAERFN